MLTTGAFIKRKLRCEPAVFSWRVRFHVSPFFTLCVMKYGDMER
jgi:hypothetical protein